MKESKEQSEDSKVRARLIELIHTASASERKELLLMLEESWPHAARRREPRKGCLFPVEYASGDRVYKDFAQNISSGGAFIETSGSFSVGQEMVFVFAPSDDGEPVKITGKIAWTDSKGIGVRFKR